MASVQAHLKFFPSFVINNIYIDILHVFVQILDGPQLCSTPSFLGLFYRRRLNGLPKVRTEAQFPKELVPLAIQMVSDEMGGGGWRDMPSVPLQAVSTKRSGLYSDQYILTPVVV